MLISLIKKILFFIFPRTMESIVRASEHNGQMLMIEERRKSKVLDNQYVLAEWIGKPAIFFGNEWQDPVIGIVIEQANLTNTSELMVRVKDYVSGDDHYVWASSLLFADKPMIDAILKLNPFERWNIRSKVSVNLWCKKYPNGEIKTPEEIKNCLRKNKFWEHNVWKEIYADTGHLAQITEPDPKR